MRISKKFSDGARALAADIFFLIPTLFSILAERLAGQKNSEKMQNSDSPPAAARSSINRNFQEKNAGTPRSSLSYGLPWNVAALEGKVSKNELSEPAPAARERAGCMGATTEEEVRGEKKRP